MYAKGGGGALEGVKVHRAHERDDESGKTMGPAHVRGRFSMKKYAPLVSEVSFQSKQWLRS